ncbi:hypothetical protein [Lactococcus lactis]|uniref:Uncharacterized protein n=1 Tax=Lactococcus lactis TaxID=1358 RepID=A0A552YWE6_9LACT|nr:hypothetical protein [Lactococcus lactis]NCB82131.1 hypothetical protein [Bacilli bacterium]TRW71566.1 hypothetical protein FNJ53_13325 [Lactococcus lactis]
MKVRQSLIWLSLIWKGVDRLTSFNVSIPQGERNSSVSRNIINQDIYDANKTEVRADESEFQSKVYEVEDGLLQ